MLHEQALRTAIAASPEASSKGLPNFAGHWINQMGSTMELAVAGRDVAGVYTSASSSGTGNPPIAGILKGFVAADLISFTVIWPNGSMTAWVGQLVDETSTPKIKTLWHLVMNVPDPDESALLWTSVLSGADAFSR